MTSALPESLTDLFDGQLYAIGAAMRTPQVGVISGVSEGARAYALQSLMRGYRSILVMTADEHTARSLYQSLLALNLERDIILLPDRDPLALEWLASDPQQSGARLQALSRLCETPGGAAPHVIVGSVRSVLQMTIPPEELLINRQRWLPGDRLRTSQVLTSWLALGYEAVAVVEERGTFCRRGGIIDVFPSHAEQPIRIELFDDEIESLRSFDPLTQRSQAPVEQLVLLPAREALPANGQDASALLGALEIGDCREDVQARWRESLEELRALRSFDGIELFLAYLHPTATALDYVPSEGLVILCGAEAIRDEAVRLDQQSVELGAALAQQGDVPPGLLPAVGLWRNLDAALAEVDLALLELGASIELEQSRLASAPVLSSRLAHQRHVLLATQAPPRFQGHIERLMEQCHRWIDQQWRVVLSSLQWERLAEVLEGAGLPARHAGTLVESTPAGYVTLVGVQLASGWASSDLRAVVLSDADIFGPQPEGRRRAVQRADQRATFLADLNVGDIVVHVDHGIGRFAGLTRLNQGSGEREYLLLQYAGADKLYVPTDQLDRVARYIGVSDSQPPLNKLGGADWTRTKAKVGEAVQKIALELLKLYAQRQASPGYAFQEDSLWQVEMEAAFPFDETPDQRKAIHEVKADMEASRIMDRLVCGDVGYGKTEVALRAAFKTVNNSKQVAILVPTTVLAQQHERTFRERLAAFPVRVEMLSRFRTKKEQANVVADLQAGTIDIVIGTHRLLQKDVRFKDLGLLVIDEEQRFGVAHKEALKQLRAEVDVLTMTATPIPRTLHMALVGVRDMSIIDTPPEERQPVKTYIAKYDDRLVRDAILRERDRGGQVFFVHNRVQSIPLIAAKIADLVPEVRVAMGHGQMAEDRLEKVMLQFAAGEFDVLVCTTIIENGLDLSNVNTIIIDQATHLGLAQLYQLRGRVGRSSRRAYAYLLYGNEQRLPPLAEKRLRAVFEASELGAGFRIAMKDLEIRGAGNLLGEEQHGHVAIVGFDLYCRMLADAVEELKGAPPAPLQSVVIDLKVEAYIPDDYVSDQATKVDCYRRLALATTLEQAGQLREELRDRFGPPPGPVRNLLAIVEIRVLALSAEVRTVTMNEHDVTLVLNRQRDYPRSNLIRRFGASSKLGFEQIRLPRQRLGTPWGDGIKEALRMVS